MAKLNSVCPSCSGKLQIAELKCPNCNININGSFEMPLLLTLSDDDQKFVLNFLKAQGAINEMERIYGVSYPTIKNRLQQILVALNLEPKQEAPKSRLEILKALELGKISAADAARKLREAV